jgi:hypothetical protein
MNSTALVANILPGTDTLCRCVQAIRTGLLERYTPILTLCVGEATCNGRKTDHAPAVAFRYVINV